MKKLLSFIVLFGTFAGTAAAQTSASLYAAPYEPDYNANGNVESVAEGMQFERADFGGLHNRFGFSEVGRLHIPQLGNPSPVISFGDRFSDSGLQQFGFGASRIFGPVRATFAYRSANDTAGPFLSSNRMFGGSFTFARGLKLSGLYESDKADFQPDSRDTREWILGASMPFGANTFMASYIRHINKTMSNADTSRFSFGYDYSLSKQTHFYTSFSHLLNEGGMLRLYAPGEGENQFNAGIRHQF